MLRREGRTRIVVTNELSSAVLERAARLLPRKLLTLKQNRGFVLETAVKHVSLVYTSGHDKLVGARRADAIVWLHDGVLRFHGPYDGILSWVKCAIASVSCWQKPRTAVLGFLSVGVQLG